jgi:hypothetical protein
MVAVDSAGDPAARRLTRPLENGASRRAKCPCLALSGPRTRLVDEFLNSVVDGLLHIRHGSGPAFGVRATDTVICPL